MPGKYQYPTKTISELLKSSNQIADAFWQLIQFWDLFTKDTLGKPLISACDLLSLYLAKAKHYQGLIRRTQLQKATDQLLEVYEWVDKAKRRKIINQSNYSLVYEYLEHLRVTLNKKS